MTALDPGERAACVGLFAAECAGPVELVVVGHPIPRLERWCCAACIDSGARKGLIERRSRTADRRASRPALDMLREFDDRAAGFGDRRAAVA